MAHPTHAVDRRCVGLADAVPGQRNECVLQGSLIFRTSRACAREGPEFNQIKRLRAGCRAFVGPIRRQKTPFLAISAGFRRQNRRAIEKPPPENRDFAPFSGPICILETDGFQQVHTRDMRGREATLEVENSLSTFVKRIRGHTAGVVAGEA